MPRRRHRLLRVTLAAVLATAFLLSLAGITISHFGRVIWGNLSLDFVGVYIIDYRLDYDCARGASALPTSEWKSVWQRRPSPPDPRAFLALPRLVGDSRRWGIVIPFWLPLTASGLGLLVLFTIGRRRPRSPTHCRACEYDLTGNITGRCPECGTPVPVAPPVELAKGDETH